MIFDGIKKSEKSELRVKVPAFFRTFDYEAKRAIFSECQHEYCSNLDIKFIHEFLKRDYSVVFVTLNQPYEKIKKEFKPVNSHFDKVYIVDCVSKFFCGGVGEKKVICVDPSSSLTKLNLTIEQVWKEIRGKKLLFFDCGELLFSRYRKEEVLTFIHRSVQRLQREGIVFFCFLKDATPHEIEICLKHFFDEIIDYK